MNDRDTLILLQPDFLDPAYPGLRFYCWHCASLEGVLYSFPSLADHIDIVRVPWPRPRELVVELLGEPHQSLPVLILAAGSDLTCATGHTKGHAFVDDKDKILTALAERHGIPMPHP